MKRAPQGGSDLLWSALGPSDDPGIGGRLLQEGVEHGWLGIFRQRFIFTIFHDADDLNPFAIPELEMTTYGLVDRSKDFAGKFTIDDCDRGSLAIVVQGESPPGQKRRPCCTEIVW
jgi:hypothetical protein